MKGRTSILLAGVVGGLLTGVLAPREAAAQAVPPVPPIASRTSGFGTASSITMIIGVGTVALMPRVYYNDPEATVGWKARWHVSQLAPALTLTAATLLVDGPIKNAIKNTRPGCTVDQTRVQFPDSGCESYGGPSTHSFASWSATGAGVGIWVADTWIHSDGKLHPGSIIGNIAVPLTASILTSVFRGISSGTDQPYESGGQIGAGIAVSLPIGFLTGLAYGALAKPNCGYGNYLVCW